MDKKQGLKRSRWLSLLTVVLLLGVLAGLNGEAQPAVAQTGTCMGDVCSVSSPCSANDVKVSIVRVYNVIDYCEFEGDTGIYEFELEFIATANNRWDPTVWIALDGDNARYGDCYSDYLTPPLATYPGSYDPNVKFYGPYWDLEDDPGTGDECGDIVGDQATFKITEPVEVQCTADLVDGTIDTAVAWDNQANPQPADDCVGGGCPGNGSKCRYEAVPFEVKLEPVDLKLTKTASEYGEFIEPGEEFKYTLTVKNVSTDPAAFSIGYEIFDDLPIWLKVIEEPITDSEYEFPTVCQYYEDDGDPDKDGVWGDNTAEWCADGVNDPASGCDGYGDIIFCQEPDDLAVSMSRSYEFWVKFWDGSTEEHCTAYPEDPRCLPGDTTNPSTIDNEACVLGNDREPTPFEDAYGRIGSFANNCDDDPVPTDVELVYFTATGNKLSIELNWETANETNNAGFNLYRSTSEDGVRIKLNSEIIPSKSPGGGAGADYSFTDTIGGRNSIKPNTLYFYWLEDVPLTGDSELFGPESASLTLGNLFKGKK